MKAPSERVPRDKYVGGVLEYKGGREDGKKLQGRAGRIVWRSGG